MMLPSARKKCQDAENENETVLDYRYLKQLEGHGVSLCGAVCSVYTALDAERRGFSSFWEERLGCTCIVGRVLEPFQTKGSAWKATVARKYNRN